MKNKAEKNSVNHKEHFEQNLNDKNETLKIKITLVNL